MMQQVFPGMMQQAVVKCKNCEGQGEMIHPADLCVQCGGRKIMSERKVLEVVVEKGMKKGDHVRFTGDGDEMPGIKLSGDVLIILDQKPHDIFKRVGQHLIVTHTVSLREALCGFELPIEHLDGHLKVMKIYPGQVMDPNWAWVAHREGMPLPDTGGVEKGNMVLNFTVEFPQNLAPQKIEKIAEAFEYSIPPKAQPQKGERLTVCKLEPYAPKRQTRGGGRNARQRMMQNDDDDDDDGPQSRMHAHMGGMPGMGGGGGGGPGGAQCQQM